ncbi:hypothetical protein [Olene mendosa nucleopolyhedrovirus]|uniref:Uncharacterized protein n=1 Tax=Olene mendosa nucleopolyhedrovirus TaxID=2933796 RepID=A0AAX3AVG7_9ABAC|nr:hypothetical protein QKV28_gp135 [Olene mendosa nucleopolyhedrovirus]UOQ18918.1 hypothetical protein [Olene mendosa nucleopolyhedrovirus]
MENLKKAMLNGFCPASPRPVDHADHAECRRLHSTFFTLVWKYFKPRTVEFDSRVLVSTRGVWLITEWRKKNHFVLVTRNSMLGSLLFDENSFVYEYTNAGPYPWNGYLNNEICDFCFVNVNFYFLIRHANPAAADGAYRRSLDSQLDENRWRLDSNNERCCCLPAQHLRCRYNFKHYDTFTPFVGGDCDCSECSPRSLFDLCASVVAKNDFAFAAIKRALPQRLFNIVVYYRTIHYLKMAKKRSLADRLCDEIKD